MRKRSGSRSKAGNSEPSTKPNGASSENGSRSTKAVNGEKGDRSMPFAFADKVVIITGEQAVLPFFKFLPKNTEMYLKTFNFDVIYCLSTCLLKYKFKI